MAVRNLIGVVPQDLALYDDLTAQETCPSGGRCTASPAQALNTRIDEVLEQIGLADKASSRSRPIPAA